MTVKEFIDWIRPITTLNPDCELKIIFSADEFELSHLHITEKECIICLKDPEV